MSSEPRVVALRCTVEPDAHPLDEPGHTTLIDPEGDVWTWASEAVGAWLSAEEWETIERLVRAARQHEHEQRRNTQTIGGCDLCDALLATSALITRLGWS
jgi:hypothetical protein